MFKKLRERLVRRKLKKTERELEKLRQSMAETFYIAAYDRAFDKAFDLALKLQERKVEEYLARREKQLASNASNRLRVMMANHRARMSRVDFGLAVDLYDEIRTKLDRAKRIGPKDEVRALAAQLEVLEKVIHATNNHSSPNGAERQFTGTRSQ